MKNGSEIVSVKARQILSERNHPGVEARVETADGGIGVAIATAGISIGEYETQFVYDGGQKWNGKGVLKAVSNVNEIIGPKIVGLDANKQRYIDSILLELDGTKLKSNLGGNALASVSAAVLKAAASSLDIPLYQHIGGVNACILPTPGAISVMGSSRYGGSEKGSGGKPSHAFMAYGFKSYSEASYACWDISNVFNRLMREKFGQIYVLGRMYINEGVVETDEEIWGLMKQAIEEAGYKDKMGIQIDVAATTYWDKNKGKFVGLFNKQEKTKEDLIKFYKHMVKNYPFVVIEDPLEENDYEGHAEVTRSLGIQVVGDDLFTTNVERLKKGIEVGACNTVLLKVNQIGTISEALDTVDLAYRNGWGVMPCNSRGEGVDIADYSVGIGSGNVRESGVWPTCNRLLQIEEELGSRAKFLGKMGFKGFGKQLYG
jgi:enolase